MFRIDPEKNSRVKQKLQALLGSKFDLSTLAVFEGLACKPGCFQEPVLSEVRKCWQRRSRARRAPARP